jgi:transmembrane 9 superfamily protein 2/4
MGDSKVHWFSIVTSLTIVIFLTAMVAMILIRTLRQDLAGYNADRTEEEEKEDIGWKLVHGDVFRTPKYANLLSVLVGTGAQVFAMTVFSIIAAAVGLMDPLLRGALLTGILILFVLMGSLAGFVGTRVYTMFGLVNWRLNAFHIATLFPGVTFGIFFLLNLILWGQGSSGAIPFHEILVLLAFWFGISVPLVYIGSMIAQKRPAVTHPLKVNTIPRQIPPQPWYMSTPTVSLVSGILPFGAVFVETFFILSSIRLHRVYHFFGFLFTVFIILVVTCIEISIVMCYFQLCSGDYNWWWRSYFTSGSSALHLLIYSLVYFGTKLELIQFVSSFLFFGYIVLISMFFFVLTGTIGFVSSLVFVRKIYSSVKFE